MPIESSSPIFQGAEDEGPGQAGGQRPPGLVEKNATDDIQASARVQRLRHAIEALATSDPLSEIPSERLAEVDQIQEHLLEHLDELNQLLQWQVERLFGQRLGSAQTVSIA